jgi:hypothetical protein
MTNDKQQKNSQEITETSDKKLTPEPTGKARSLSRSLLGAIISGGGAFALYTLMSSIAETYANKPITSTSLIAVKISIAVRTLVTGVAALAAGIFAFVSLGLLLLTIQMVIQGGKQDQSVEK